MNSKLIYCDHNATTPVHSDVQASFVEALSVYGNASSLYQLGRQAKEAIEFSRQQLADCLGASVDQLIFTGSGTEANNHVLMQAIYLKRQSSDPVHILVSSIEHSSVKETTTYLKSFDIECDFIPVDDNGCIDISVFKGLFKSYTRLVSVVLANNEIGTIQDIQLLCEIAHEHAALFHTDAVQALGKYHIDVNQLNVDFMSFSSHKLYAPKGVGALYIKDETNVNPLLYGGHHERGLRASTENVPGIIAFGTAVSRIDVSYYQQHTESLIEFLKQEFLVLDGVVVNAANSPLRLTNTLNITFSGCSGYALAMNCDLEGIALSTGSACSVGSIEPSHVLDAIGVSVDDNKSSIRFSVGLTNSIDEMHVVVKTVKAIVDRLRSC